MQRRARQVGGAKPQAVGCLGISGDLDNSALAEQVPQQSSMANMFGVVPNAMEDWQGLRGTDPNCRLSMLAAASCAACTLAYCVKGTPAPAESPDAAGAMFEDHHGVFADLTSPVNQQHPPKTASMVQRKISGRTKVALKKSRKAAQEESKRAMEQLCKTWRKDIEEQLDSWGVDRFPSMENEDLVPRGSTSPSTPNAATHGPSQTRPGHGTFGVSSSPKKEYLRKGQGKMACKLKKQKNFVSLVGDTLPQVRWDWRGKHEAFVRQLNQEKAKQKSTRTSFVDILGARKGSTARGLREVICLNVGGAGVSMGDATWELFCLEHGIQPDGAMPSDNTIGGEHDAFNTFFAETRSGRHVPRCVMVDLEPTFLDGKIRTGPRRRMFAPSQLLSLKEDTAALYSEGYYGRDSHLMMEAVMNAVRRMAGDCDDLQGFMVFQSAGGGTGSGLGALLAERFKVDYGKKVRICSTVLPAAGCFYGNTTEDYNTVLSLHNIVSNYDLTVPYDNAAIYDICRRNIDIERPTYSVMNELIAQHTSSLTSSMRFDGALFSSLSELVTSMVPYPRINFLMSCYAPIAGENKPNLSNPSVAEITKLAFQPDSMFLKVDPGRGKYLACSLMYRGDVGPRDVNVAVAGIKTKRIIKFVDWCPVSFKCGINRQPPRMVGGDLVKQVRDVAMVSNNSAIGEVFAHISQRFDLRYSKRTFVHHYVCSGMDEDEFGAAAEDIKALKKDYDEVARDKGDDDDEEEDEY